MRRVVMTAAVLLGGLLGMVQAGYWCECFCAVLGQLADQGEGKIIANRVAAFAVKRRVAVRPPIGCNERADEELRWLIVVPAAALLMAGLLALALSRIAGGPSLEPALSSVGADVNVRDVEIRMDADGPLVVEVETGGTGSRRQ